MWFSCHRRGTARDIAPVRLPGGTRAGAANRQRLAVVTGEVTPPSETHATVSADSRLMKT
ncbi:hypothetical protein CFIICLFH_3082 [Methylobacterium goesingense]|nr:hypothetical protein CFIICLFH_3082 [Methylobacterium goesingense]